MDRRRLVRARTVLAAACAIGIAGVAGWILAGGGVEVVQSLPFSDVLYGKSPSVAANSSGGVPVHIDTEPAGAQVRIDGSSVGETPLDVRVEPGSHVLYLQHPDALDDEQTIRVSDTGATLDVGLWRKRPDVLPIRPVYPGASLLDARFLNDGHVALLVGFPLQPGAPNPSRERWLLDPGTGELARVETPGMDSSRSSTVLAPDGDRVAYVTPGASVPSTVTGWSTSGSAAKATPTTAQTESVWLASLESSQPPHRIFQLSPYPSASMTTVDPAHIVDLVWTPDGSQLVAITRQTGPPVRSRVFLLNLSGASDSQIADADQLVLLPAEVLPDSAVVDPGGHWLALVARSAGAGGNNLVTLCVLELRHGGAFRNVADLGTGASVPIAAPVAWAPDADRGAGERLIFVGPAPPAAASGGLFGIFGALRPAPTPSGLFIADLEKNSGLSDAQPRRLGTAINNFGLVWRFPTTLYGFARQDDGTLALHSIDPTSGAVRDLGVRLPPGIAHGTAGLSARWDARRGYALLLVHASAGGSSATSTGGDSLQAWLVSFIPASAKPGAAH